MTDANTSSNGNITASKIDDYYYYTNEGDSGSGGGTAIVIIIAILIVIIPLGFIISCIVKKIQERRNKDKGKDGSVPLPDHSQNVSSPERPLPGGNMYPYGSPGDYSENNGVGGFSNNIYGGMVEGGFSNQYGGAASYMDGPQPI